MTQRRAGCWFENKLLQLREM